MNIVFMGTPDFARDSLKALVEAGHNINLVVTNPDKPKGRGMKLIPSDVKVYAESQNIKIVQPIKVKKNEEFIAQLKAISPDVIVVVAYGKIIPKEILEIPKFGCINVHGSLLPNYRGAAPIQWSVLNGDKETGITTMYMDEGMDTGDIILQQKTEIGEDETTGELWNRLSKIGAELLVRTISQIENGTAPRVKQPENCTIAPMIEKEMAKINWEKQTSNEIKNLVRGLNPFMGAYSNLNGHKFKFWKVQIGNNSGIPGTILVSDAKDGLEIATVDGSIKVLEIQGENAKKMNIADFLRGNTLQVLEKFN